LTAGCLVRPTVKGPPVRLVTSVGAYPPVGLLAAAAVVRRGENALDADRLGRLAGMPVAVALLILAAVALFQSADGWLSLAGILGACTPTAIFLAASMTPSGLSVSAGIALTASLLRIGRPDLAPRWVWVLFGLSAGALALSHPTGIAWAILLIVGFVASDGVGATRQRVRRQLRVALPGLGLLAAGILASLVWQTLYGPSTPLAYRAIPLALTHAPDQYWDGVRDLVGGFGYLEFRLPLVVYLLWFVFVIGLAAAAVRVGRPREKLSVIAAAALAILVPVGLWTLFGRAVGTGLNGREYMPLLVAFPLLAGEVVYRNRARLSAMLLRTLAALACTTGVLQFIAWYLNGRRAAVGIAGSLLFPAHAQWSPPLGWIPWLLLAGAGALMLVIVSIAPLATARRVTPSR